MGRDPLPSALTSIFALARAAPERLALLHCGEPISYGALAHAILSVRAALIKAGTRRGDCACVCIASLRDAWPALLALRSLGVTTLSTQGSGDAAQLGRAGVTWLISSVLEPPSPAAAAAKAYGWNLVRLALDDFRTRTPEGDEGAEGEDQEGAHILLSSGTTGAYKMLRGTAAHLRARVENILECRAFTPDSVHYLAGLGPWSAAGFHRPMAMWSLGAAVAFEQRPAHEADFLSGPVTDATLTIEGLKLALQAMPHDAPRRDAMTIVVAGGAVPWPLVQETRARVTMSLLNLLGSTEGGTIAETLLEKPGDQQWYRILPSRRVEVVDENDQPVPAGVTGELRIALLAHSDGVYWGGDPRSAEFLRNGFFYPGDLAVIGADGRIAMLGRKVDVITLADGNKIATAPVEEVLQVRLGLSGACVLATPDGKSGTDIVHVVLECDAPPHPAELERALSSLPLPAPRVHLTPKLPRNAMGKIDRKALTMGLGMGVGVRS